MNTEHIQKLIDQQVFVDVFDDNAEESFFGYIIAQSGGLIQLEHYDEEGRFDGVLIFEKETLSRIRWGGNELSSTETLIVYRASSAPVSTTDIRSAVLSLYEQFQYVCLTLGSYGTDVIFIGEIDEHLEESLILHEYGTRSSQDSSRLLIRWDDITRVQAGGVYEQNIHNQYS